MNATTPLRRFAIALLLCSGAIFALGCDSSSEGQGNVCDPGETQTCVCPDGSGAQSCNTSGTGWESCVCGNSSPTTNPGDALSSGADTSRAGVQDVAQAVETSTEPDSSGPECTPKAEMACDGDTLVWLDSCGNFDENIESCAPGGYCSGGECIAGCTPHATKRCVGNDVYFFDSCGVKEGAAEACDDDQFCEGCQETDDICSKEAQCIKGFFDGTWKVTADPDSKDACGMGNSPYLPMMLELSIDGTTATAHADVGGLSIDYTGTLEGKNLKLSGEYSQTETVLGYTITIDHVEDIDVYFTTLEYFEGLSTDAFSMPIPMMGDIPCTLYWNITGIKQ